MRKCEFCIHSYYNLKNELTINLNACNLTACKCASKRMKKEKKDIEGKRNDN